MISQQQSFKTSWAEGYPGMHKVVVQNVPYRTVDDTSLTMDIYYPPDMKADERLPVVIFVFGYTDSAAKQLVGSPLKDYDQYTSWGRLAAASGLIALTYQTQQPDDLEALVQYTRKNAASMNIDADRIGLWSCSANVPTAVSFAMQRGREYLKFAVFYYGHLLTPDNEVREQIDGLCSSRGCYAAELRDVEELRKDLPLFVVRAGRDTVPFVNESIDHFMSAAAASDMLITLVEYAEGAHGFDTERWTDRSSEIIEQTLEFMKTNLAGE
jgi:acetyl esterase/lipase